MCRYASFLPAEAMARIFGTVNPLPNLAVLERRADVGRGSCSPSPGHLTRAAPAASSDGSRLPQAIVQQAHYLT
jgi:hypothetical protein